VKTDQLRYEDEIALSRTIQVFKLLPSSYCRVVSGRDTGQITDQISYIIMYFDHIWEVISPARNYIT